MRLMSTTTALLAFTVLTACGDGRLTRDVTVAGQNPEPYSEAPGASNIEKLDSWSTVGASQQGSNIEESERRLAHLANLFKDRGTSAAFNTLNGKDSTNDSGQRLQDNDFKVNISDPDGRVSGVKCIQSSRFVVTGTGQGVDSDASNWRDVTGKPILMTMIQGLRAGSTPTARINYTIAVPSPVGGAPITKDMTAVVASSRYLLGKKNDTGKKFLCYIEIEGN